MKKNLLSLRKNKKHISAFIFVLSLLFQVIFSGANAQSDTIQTNVPALKNVYANDFYIGCILSYR